MAGVGASRTLPILRSASKYLRNDIFPLGDNPTVALDFETQKSKESINMGKDDASCAKMATESENRTPLP